MYKLTETDIQIQNINYMCTNMSEDFITSYSNVVGIGCGEKISNGINTKAPTLTYLVEKKVSKDQLSSSDIIPNKINGVPTDVIEVGEVLSQPYLLNSSPTSQSLTSQYRPIPGGVSCGTQDLLGAGTLGCAVRDTSNIYILSNNHVIANVNKSKIGSSIYQPAYYEGGSSTEPFASLYNYKQIKLGSGGAYSVNKIDAALGYVGKRNDSSVNTLIQSGIAELGAVKGITTDLVLGQAVSKTGRTTGLTSGNILLLNASIIVNYSLTEKALFTGQIVSSVMSLPGDSGSIGLDKDNKAFGLLFAGTRVATFYNPIVDVLSEFNISILE